MELVNSIIIRWTFGPFRILLFPCTDYNRTDTERVGAREWVATGWCGVKGGWFSWLTDSSLIANVMPVNITEKCIIPLFVTVQLRTRIDREDNSCCCYTCCTADKNIYPPPDNSDSGQWRNSDSLDLMEHFNLCFCQKNGFACGLDVWPEDSCCCCWAYNGTRENDLSGRPTGPTFRPSQRYVDLLTAASCSCVAVCRVAASYFLFFFAMDRQTVRYFPPKNG